VVPTKSSGHVTAGFWGCICLGGAIALAETPPRMDFAGYCEILEVMLPHINALFGEGHNLHFAQDNATIHTSRATRAWFAAHPQFVLLPWPPHSPDLNPIEHVWAFMAREWDSRNEGTKEELQAHVREIWGVLERRPDIIRSFVSNMRDRLQAVIDTDGGYTKY